MLASGQGVIPFVVIGIPAAALGLCCLAIAAFMAFQKNNPRSDRSLYFLLAAIVLFVVAFISPALDPLLERLLGH